MRRLVVAAMMVVMGAPALAEAPPATANERQTYAGDSVFQRDHGRGRRLYNKQLRQFTRELYIYRGLETALIMRATYLASEFRDDVARERARLVGPSPDDQHAFEDRLRDDGQAYHEVVFSADSALPRGDKFGGDGWQLRLVADGTEETLVTMFKVDHPTPLQNQIYSHQTLWSDLWIARFAKTVADPKLVELKVGGGYGHGDLVWRLE
jgi:hypothetical protein